MSNPDASSKGGNIHIKQLKNKHPLITGIMMWSVKHIHLKKKKCFNSKVYKAEKTSQILNSEVLRDFNSFKRRMLMRQTGYFLRPHVS